jgi:putative hydrolase of the HAD superfamily
MIKAIIFDLDNTLINFWKFKTKSVDAAINAMINAGLGSNKGDARRIIQGLYEKRGMEYKYIFQELLREVEGKIDYRILSHGLVAYRRTRGNLLVPYKGVKPTLVALKRNGYKLAIISDAPRIKAWTRLVSMEIDNLFDVVVVFEDTGKTKPHSLPFSKAIKKLKVKPSQVLMVGDNIKRDIQGAKRLGMKTAFARYGDVGVNKNLKSNADFELDRIEELLNVVKKTK